MIYCSKETPKWVCEWTKWAAELLLPQWDVYVTMVDKFEPDPTHPYFADDREAESDSHYVNMRCDMKVLNTLSDIGTSHVIIVHEICHAFLSCMSAAAENLITNEKRTRNLWEVFEDAEETRVVILSRLLVSLRMQQLAGSKH